MKSHGKKKMPLPAAPAAAEDLLEALRPWLLAGFVALCVARPLLPSEGVSWLGDGQPFNMLALILTGGYLLAVVVHGGFTHRFCVVDAAAAALVALCVLSALVGVSFGSPRMSVNMLWEWAGMGLFFFLARQLVRSAQEARMLVALMLALAVVLSCIGFYQVLIGFPAQQAAYAENPDEVLRSAGQWFPPGSPGRLRFESRLHGTEPLATFALTNSLAGFLAPWLLMALAIGWNRTQGSDADSVPGRSAARTLRGLALALCILIVAGCFVFTKSRSGYVALAVGAALLPFAIGAGRRVFQSKFALLAGVLLLVLLGAAVATKGLDIQVLTEASKSLSFRLEYWQATFSLIGDNPWLGVGPGNFQDFYMQYKLPWASEEIRDPHNFLMEVWATGGTFAMMALCVLLLAFGWTIWRTSFASAEFPPADAEKHRPNESRQNLIFMALGGGAGFLLAFLIGPLFGFALPLNQLGGGLLLSGVVLAILWPWIVAGDLSPRVLALGVLVLTIHWLAAGGIAYPGVAGTFWILLALGLRQSTSESDAQASVSRKRKRRAIAAVSLLAICAAATACYLTAYQPVLGFQQIMSKVHDVRHPEARGVALMDAVAADPLAAEPWLALAELDLEKLKKDPSSGPAYQHFVRATALIMTLRPHSSSTWRQVGHWYLELYQYNHDPQAVRTAVECFRGAVRMYPNSAMARGELALALESVERTDAARRHAQEALELDDAMPHADQKLSAAMRQRLEHLAAEPR